MAVRGGGPSRRSHTKSRKGCKTCKRRHIRCDESFPQCRNCTKHHVRCDYLDATTPDTDSFTTASSEQASPTPTPTSDESVRLRPDSLYSELSLSFSGDPEIQYGADAQLVNNLYAIVDNLDSKGASDMTIWASYMRRHLSIAPANPCVMDALKAFSASQIAWVTQSVAAREQSLQYSTSALSGLHQAVGQFSKENADSVLVTAVLLISQSRDWQSWSALLGGLSSITASIETWSEESLYADLVRSINYQFAYRKNVPEAQPISDVERTRVFTNIDLALRQLRSSLTARPLETHWVDQFIDLVTHLKNTAPASTPEAEFNHLYILRKWAFYLPVLLLQEGPIDVLKLAVVAHLYGIALALGPVYPQIAFDLCRSASYEPLVSTLSRIESMKGQLGFFDPADLSALTRFPQEALAQFNASMTGSQPPPPSLQIPDISMYFTDQTNAPGNLSPAFTPAAFEPAHTRASSTASNYLEVPPNVSYNGQIGFSHNISDQWDTYPSPGFPTQTFFSGDDLLFADDEAGKPLADPTFGAYIQPCEIWT